MYCIYHAKICLYLPVPGNLQTHCLTQRILFHHEWDLQLMMRNFNIKYGNFRCNAKITIR
jgi:hypothetical protein